MRRFTWLLLCVAACEDAGKIDIDDGLPDDGVVDTDLGGVTDTDEDATPADTDDPPPVDTDDTTPPGDTDVVQVDPNDPPVDPPACGQDLDVHNGTVVPALGVVGRPGAYAGDPAARGSFKLVKRTGKIPNPTRGRDRIPLTTWAPSTDGTSPAAGPFPLVLVMPGFGYSYTGYDHLIEPLVSHGFVVVGMDFPNTGFLDAPAQDKNVLEVRAVLDYALTLSPHAAVTDATKVALAGHSAGGKQAFWAASTDPRVDLVIGWDPQNGGGPPCAIGGITGLDCNDDPVAPNCQAQDPGLEAGLRAETLVFAAEDDTLTPDEHLRAIQFYRGAPSPAHLVRLPNAGHADWINDGPTSRISRAVGTSLLLTRFYGYTGLEGWLPGGATLDAERIVGDVRSK